MYMCIYIKLLYSLFSLCNITCAYFQAWPLENQCMRFFFFQLTLASASEGELLPSIVGLSISVKLLQLLPRHTQMLVSQVQPSPIEMTIMISCHWWCTAYKLGNVYNGMYPLCSNTEKVSFILTFSCTFHLHCSPYPSCGNHWCILLSL